MPIQYFNPIFRQHTAPADLNEIAKTYDVLEAGHQQAIQTQTKVATELANLDLNEAEDGWRQEQINKIQNAVTDNSNYGNAYSALDNIVKTYGDISSNTGMIGRLRAQKDYKTYIDTLDKRGDLSEDKKNYFREVNQYKYADVSDKNGNIIGGTKWQPTDREVSEIPLSQLIKEGINIAAKEKGGGTQTRWLDSKGNVTSDPNQVFDGEVYNSSTNQWERLTKDKIRQGIEAFIETTPGAKASLDQDYKIALWKKDKYGSNPDIEDKNGITLSTNDYLIKRINPAINAASYYNSVNNTTYGAGLKTYKAAQNAAKQGQTQQEDNRDLYNIGTHSTPITVEYDYAGTLKSNKQTASTNLQNIFKQIMGREFQTDMTNASPTAWKHAIDNAINQSKLSSAQKTSALAAARKNIRDYTDAVTNYNEIIKGLDNNQKSNLDFISRMNNGAELDITNANDKYVRDNINTLFTGKTENIRFYPTDLNMYESIINTLNGDKVNGYKQLGFITGINNDGQRYIELNKNNYNKSVLLANAIKQNKPSFFGNIANAVKGNKPYRLERIDSDGNVYDAFGQKDVSGLTSLMNIADKYDKVNNKINETLNAKTPTKITTDNFSYGDKTFTGAKLYQDYTKGKLVEKEYNLIDKRLKDQVESSLINHNYTQGNMFKVMSKDGSGTLEKETSSEERKAVGDLIKSYIGTNKYKPSAAHNPFYGNGTNITIYKKLNDKGEPIGDPETYFIPNLIIEQAANDFDNDPYIKAADAISIGNEIKKTNILTTTDDTPTMGEQKIICNGNEQFIYSVGDHKFNVTRDQAVNISSYVNEYIDIKDSFISGDLQYNAKGNAEATMTLMQNSIIKIAQEIANNVGMPERSRLIYNSLINDLNK